MLREVGQFEVDSCLLDGVSFQLTFGEESRAFIWVLLFKWQLIQSLLYGALKLIFVYGRTKPKFFILFVKDLSAGNF